MRRPWRSSWYRDTCPKCGAVTSAAPSPCAASVWGTNGPWTIIYPPACGIVTEEHLGWRRPKGQGWTQT